MKIQKHFTKTDSRRGKHLEGRIRAVPRQQNTAASIWVLAHNCFYKRDGYLEIWLDSYEAMCLARELMKAIGEEESHG